MTDVEQTAKQIANYTENASTHPCASCVFFNSDNVFDETGTGHCAVFKEQVMGTSTCDSFKPLVIKSTQDVNTDDSGNDENPEQSTEQESTETETETETETPEQSERVPEHTHKPTVVPVKGVAPQNPPTVNELQLVSDATAITYQVNKIKHINPDLCDSSGEQLEMIHDLRKQRQLEHILKDDFKIKYMMSYEEALSKYDMIEKPL